MSGKPTVEALNSLFEDAVKAGLPVFDGGNHLLVDPAPNISFKDIAQSKLTDKAKQLIGAGFMSSGGLMQLKFIRQLPEESGRGQMTMEFSGTRTRIGAEVVTQFDKNLEPTNLKFLPGGKMLVLYPLNPELNIITDKLMNTPENVQEEDSLALVALARKAIGLTE